jgi:hypothetical protein
MGAQPVGQRLRGAVGQHVDRTARFDVDQQGLPYRWPRRRRSDRDFRAPAPNQLWVTDLAEAAEAVHNERVECSECIDRFHQPVRHNAVLRISIGRTGRGIEPWRKGNSTRGVTSSAPAKSLGRISANAARAFRDMTIDAAVSEFAQQVTPTCPGTGPAGTAQLFAHGVVRVTATSYSVAPPSPLTSG